MKRLILLTVLATTVLTAAAAAPLDTKDYSISLTDDSRAALVNPAAMAFGNASGISLIYNNNDTNDLYQFFNYGYFAAGWGLEGESLYKTFSAAAGPVYNVYTGAGFSWLNSDYEGGIFTAGLLVRPADALSLAAVFNGTLAGSWEIGASLGLRPLWFTAQAAHRLQAAADIYYSMDGFSLPVIHLQSEPLDGLRISGRYSFEENNFRLALSWAAGGLLSEVSTGLDISNGFDSVSIDAPGMNALSMNALSLYSHMNLKEYSSAFTHRSLEFSDYPLSGVISENPGIMPGGFAFLSGSGRTVWEVIEELSRLKDDDRIGGLVFRNQLFQASWTNIHELEKALLDFKSAGKKIIWYFEAADTNNYALAAATGDAVYLNPSGSIALAGRGAVNLYFNDFLAKYGIRTVDLKSHEYKTANNTYTQSSMTDAEREALTEVYTDLQLETERMIAEGRGNRLSSSAVEIFNHGPYLMAADALEAGLVDALIYEAELDKTISENFNNAGVRKGNLAEKIRQDWADPYPAQIALIYATGAIYSGEAIPGQAIGSDTLVAALREARDNPLTRAIVLRVDSPGGSALASDIIAEEVSICRNEPYNLPVVVSMGSVAGSGGYYIACTSDYIYAQPDTITGSIGVTGFSFDVEGLLDHFEINAASLLTRENADFGNLTREMTEEEYKALKAYIQGTYDIFVNRVAEGRGMSYEEVHKVAQGRIWSGRKAEQLGLIDSIGYFDDAVKKAAELAGIKHEHALVAYDGYYAGLDDIGSLYLQSMIKEQMPAAAIELAQELDTISRFGNFQALTLMPWQF